MLNIGIVGAGFITEINAKVLSEIKEARIACVVDKVYEKAR